MKLNFTGLQPYLIERLQEASTYRGLILIITTLGLTIDSTQGDAIVAFGLGLSGILGVLLEDTKKGKKK